MVPRLGTPGHLLEVGGLGVREVVRVDDLVALFGGQLEHPQLPAKTVVDRAEMGGRPAVQAEVGGPDHLVRIVQATARSHRGVRIHQQT